MTTRRWFDQSQPQTMQIAVFLLYANAVMLALLGGGLRSGLGILLVLGGIAGGFGIANEKRWGYGVGLAVAVGDLLLRAGTIIGLAFAIALVALLLHPQSRDYQRIWFR